MCTGIYTISYNIFFRVLIVPTMFLSSFRMDDFKKMRIRRIIWLYFDINLDKNQRIYDQITNQLDNYTPWKWASKYLENVAVSPENSSFFIYTDESMNRTWHFVDCFNLTLILNKILLLSLKPIKENHLNYLLSSDIAVGVNLS